MRKTFRKIHLWLSIPLGLIISIICLSGATLVFENEVMERTRHDLYFVQKVGTAPLPVDELATKVAAILPDSILVTGVTVSADPERACQVNLSKPRRASVYVNPYTGEVLGKYERAPFFLTMFKLHRWLLDSMKPDRGIFWGKMIVGASTLMFIFVLISGLVAWLPKSIKALKRSFRISVNKGWRRFWYDLHIAGGVYTFLFLTAMALTGLTWSFSWYRTGFYRAFGVKTEQSNVHAQTSHPKKEGHKKDAGEVSAAGNFGGGEDVRRKSKKSENSRRKNSSEHPSPFAFWHKVYEQLKTRNPEFKQISISKEMASVSFNRLGNQRATDRYRFNPQNGEITETVLYKDLDRSGKIRGWIFSVHVGSWGGMVTRILSFLAALIGGTLPLTGYYLWIKKKKKRRTNRAG